jgi:hypothetical protein
MTAPFWCSGCKALPTHGFLERLIEVGSQARLQCYGTVFEPKLVTPPDQAERRERAESGLMTLRHGSRVNNGKAVV